MPIFPASFRLPGALYTVTRIFRLGFFSPPSRFFNGKERRVRNSTDCAPWAMSVYMRTDVNQQTTLEEGCYGRKHGFLRPEKAAAMNK